MANCSSNKSISESEYTKEGLALWLNNMPERSEVHFKENLERTPIFAGYVFVLSMVSMCFYLFLENLSRLHLHNVYTINIFDLKYTLDRYN